MVDAEGEGGSGARTVNRPGTALDEMVLQVIRGGFFSTLPRPAAVRLLAEGIRINVPAGSLVYQEEESPRVILVVNGLLRVFLTSAGGRQVTVRYARSGDVAGLVMVLGGPVPMSIQAMTSSLLVALRVASLRAMLATDPGVARACAEELTRQLQHLLDEISEQAFLTVRQRLVRQMLLLATTGPGRNLVVRVEQHELADAIGSVREVVTRNLHQLQDEGLIEISRDAILIRDPLALADVAHEPGRRDT
jgi:CRP/FNR family cyclic AMP-dependent transcriptional regulator